MRYIYCFLFTFFYFFGQSQKERNVPLVIVQYTESKCDESLVDFFGVPNNEGSICYGKAFLSKRDTTAVSSYFIPVYFGTEKNLEGVEPINFVVREESTSWQKRFDKNCGNKNSPSCYNWCLVKIPAETVTIQSVTDTNKVDEFYIKEIRTLSVQMRSWTEVVEVVCEKNINKTLLLNVVNALKVEGFTDIKASEKMNLDLKMALNKYQSSKNLPMGNLNFATLDALGISY